MRDLSTSGRIVVPCFRALTEQPRGVAPVFRPLGQIGSSTRLGRHHALSLLLCFRCHLLCIFCGAGLGLFEPMRLTPPLILFALQLKSGASLRLHHDAVVWEKEEGGGVGLICWSLISIPRHSTTLPAPGWWVIRQLTFLI